MDKAVRREGWGISRRGNAYLSELSILKEHYYFSVPGKQGACGMMVGGKLVKKA